MTKKVKITVKNLQKKLPVQPRKIKKAVLEVLLSEKNTPAFSEITICILSDNKIRELNRSFLGRDVFTDVIAFSMPNERSPGKLLGDIAISADTVLRNSSEYGNSFMRELELCAIHGVLHLLGYRDYTSKEKALMRKKEAGHIKA